MAARILIIDEEPGWINLTPNDMDMACEVDVAKDLETALAKLKKERYDLIIASSRQLEALETIHDGFPEKRVVVATGRPTTREAINIYRLGALDYFAKDLRREVVFEKIQEAVKKPVRVSA